jgi:hypothetical protein
MQSWFTNSYGLPGTYGDPSDPSPAFYPPGSIPITEAQYNADLAAWQAGRDALIAADAASDCAARKALYLAMAGSSHFVDLTDAQIRMLANFPAPDAC